MTDADARTSTAIEALERAVACDPRFGVKVTSVSNLNRSGEEVDLLSPVLAQGKNTPNTDGNLSFVEGREFPLAVATALGRPDPICDWTRRGYNRNKKTINQDAAAGSNPGQPKQTAQGFEIAVSIKETNFHKHNAAQVDQRSRHGRGTKRRETYAASVDRPSNEVTGSMNILTDRRPTFTRSLWTTE